MRRRPEPTAEGERAEQPVDSRARFTGRGWAFLGAGALCLLLATWLGRKDVLALALFLGGAPLFAALSLYVVKPRVLLKRGVDPALVTAGDSAVVRLRVRHRTRRGGTVTGAVAVHETVPEPLGGDRELSVEAGGEPAAYTVRPRRRGVYALGPATVRVADPFGLAAELLDASERTSLHVAPDPVELPEISADRLRESGTDPSRTAQPQPGPDNVTTREYRHGDPMRRVHWAATARHGDLMVRQEESVTTPEATVIMDHRYGAFSGGSGGGPAGQAGPDGHPMATSGTFEWSVVAVMSISAHLAERNYALRLLDTGGSPAFLQSPSAPEPEVEEYSGAAGLQSIAESLAAIQLTGPHHPHRDNALQQWAGRVGASNDRTALDAGPEAFDDLLMDKLSAHRMRGPVIAVLGTLSRLEALALAPAAGYATNAFAVIVTEKPGESAEVLEVLRQGGWRAVAVAPAVPVASAWSQFDQDVAVPAPSAEVRRGTGAAL